MHAKQRRSGGVWRDCAVNPWLHLVLIALAVSVHALICLPRVPLENDECTYLTIVRGSLRAGDWIHPQLFGNQFVDKPPLQLWLLTIPQALSASGLTLPRLPSVGWTIAIYFGLYELGRRYWNVAVGLGACAALLANPAFHWNHGALQALMEAPLSFGWILTMLGLCAAAAPVNRMTERENGKGNIPARAALRPAILIGLGVACGFLVKGIAGGAALMLAPVAWLAAPSGQRRTAALAIAGSGVIFLLAISPWIISQLADGPSEFIKDFWKFNVEKRAFGSFDPRHEQPAEFYFISIKDRWGQWKPFLWPALAALAITAAFPGRTAERLLLSWIVLPLAAFSLMVSKLNHYIYPLYPAIALALPVAFHHTAAAIAAALNRSGQLNWPSTIWRAAGWRPPRAVRWLLLSAAAGCVLLAVWIALWGRVRWQLGPVRFQAAGIGRPLVFAFGLLWLSGFCRDVYGMVSAASAAVFALTALSLLPASVPPPLTGPAKEEVLSELMETHAAGKRIFVIQFTGEWWEQDWCKRLYFDRFELADRPSPEVLVQVLDSPFNPFYIISPDDSAALQKQFAARGWEYCELLLWPGEPNGAACFLTTRENCPVFVEFNRRFPEIPLATASEPAQTDEAD